MYRLFSMVLLAGLLSCGLPASPTAPFEGTAPIFQLTDLNETSPTAGDQLSPEDYRGRISVWYFGHAT